MKKNRILCLIVACLTLGLASCNDEEPVEYSFNAQMEQPTSADSSKVYLQDERYIYWELTPSDKITIAGDQGLRDEKDKFYEARLIDANTLDGEDENNFGTFNGVFVTTMQWGSVIYWGSLTTHRAAPWASACGAKALPSNVSPLKAKKMHPGVICRESVVTVRDNK